MHDVYGIDVGDDDLMAARSWRWLHARVSGLLTADTRLSRVLTPPAESKER